MKDGGHVDSLRFTGANINSTETMGVVDCEILDNALASNIQVENAFVATSGEKKGVNAPGISRNPKPLFNLLFGGLWLDLPERDSDLIPLFIINPD